MYIMVFHLIFSLPWCCSLPLLTCIYDSRLSNVLLSRSGIIALNFMAFDLTVVLAIHFWSSETVAIFLPPLYKFFQSPFFLPSPDQPLPSNSENKSSNQQAPGEGICSSVSDSGNHSEGQNESLIHALINSKECWGRRPVDQTTPWDLSALNEELASVVNSAAAVTAAPAANSSSNQGLLGDAVSLAAAARQRRSVTKPGSVPVAVPAESNVWSSEPPNGTGIWEMHYEGGGPGEGRATNRWKTPGSTPAVPSLNSPPGGHRMVPPPSSSFISPPAIPQQQPTAAATRGFQNNNFFPTSGPQPQQRFGQPAAGGQQPPPGTGRGPPNGMFGPAPNSAFKSQGVPQASSGWPPLSLTPDNQSKSIVLLTWLGIAFILASCTLVGRKLACIFVFNSCFL